MRTALSEGIVDGNGGGLEGSRKLTDFLDEAPQIDEEENQSSKNVYSNMKKLGQSLCFSNPSRLLKQSIPDFEPRPNDLNSLVSPNGKINANSKNPTKTAIDQSGIHSAVHESGVSASGRSFKVGNPPQGAPMESPKKNQQRPSLAEENVNDLDYSSSEFDVSENETIGPLHNVNSPIFNLNKSSFFNQKIKEFNERKSRCNTLLPQQAQKYFRDQKLTKSYIQTGTFLQTNSTKVSAGFESTQVSSAITQEIKSKERGRTTDKNTSNNNAKVSSRNQTGSKETSEDYLTKKEQFRIEMKRLQEQQDQFQKQIASNLTQSLLEGSQINSIISDSSKGRNASPAGLHLPSPKTNSHSNKQVTLPHRQFKEDVIQRQIAQSQIIQVKLQEQAKSIEEKKTAFQDQFIRNQSQQFKKATQQQQQQHQMQGDVSFQKSPTVTSQNNHSFVEHKDTMKATNGQSLPFRIDQQPGIVQIQQSNVNQSQAQERESITTLDGRKVNNNLEGNNLNKQQQQQQFYQDLDRNDTASIQNINNNTNNHTTPKKQYLSDKQLSLKSQKLISNTNPNAQNNSNLVMDQSQQFNQMQHSVLTKSKKSMNQIHNDHDLLNFPETENFLGSINTIDVRVDTQTIKTMKLADKKEKYIQEDTQVFELLIQALFSNDIAFIEAILQQIINEERYHLINQIDFNGNTPLLLAVKLAYQNRSYYQVIKLLLAYDADPRIRDRQDWSCFEEVASQQNYQLASLLFESLIEWKHKAIMQQKREVDNMLSEVPDFYVEMKWEFESSIIPFVSKLAPSDTFKIWKYGRSVRCDSTYAGLQKYKAKRRAQSLIFNALNLPQDNPVIQNTDYSFLTIIHKDEKTFHFPLQELDDEEKSMIIHDLLGSSESFQGDLKIEKSSISPSKTLFGGAVTSKVQGYTCQKYDLSLKYRYMIFKKTHVPLLITYDRYINSDIPGLRQISPRGNNASYQSDQPIEGNIGQQLQQYPDSVQNINFSNQNINSNQNISTNNNNNNNANSHINAKHASLNEIKLNGIDAINPFDIQITETSKQESKKQTLSLYVCDDFPMKFSVFLPLLQFLSNGNSLLMNLCEVFNDPSVKEIMFTKGFPVKLQIPLSYSIYANITFSAHKPLSSMDSDDITSLFSIPEGSNFVNRKEKQNTMKKQKKRMVMANIFIS